MRHLVLFATLAATVLATSHTKFDRKSEELTRFQDVVGDESMFNDSERSLKEYLAASDLSFELPIIGSTLTMDARNLDNDELDLKLDFGQLDSGVEARKKSKIKKIVVPILVFILIKALVLIPLALGILGIKTWNAVQLSFISFISSIALAIWKLCSKVNEHPPTVIHNAFDPYHHDRSDVPQQMAYSGYTST